MSTMISDQQVHTPRLTSRTPCGSSPITATRAGAPWQAGPM